jgi:hypothetical protein
MNYIYSPPKVNDRNALSVVVLGGLGYYVSCPNAVSSRVIHLVFHRLQYLRFSSLDSINMVYQHRTSF